MPSLTAIPAQVAGAAAGTIAPAPRPGEGVRRMAASAETRRRTTLRRVDYQDVFELDLEPSPTSRTAEQWIREILEGAPDALQRRLVRGWTALGLRLESRRDPGCVLGWRVRLADETAVVLGAPSRIGMPAELVLLRGSEALTFSTLIRFGNPAVRVLWAAVEPAHLRVVPDLLALTRRRLLGSS